METDQIAGQLAGLLEATRSAERQLFGALDPSARDAVPAGGGWSSKDVQVHVFVWKARQVERLARAAHGQSIDPLANAEIDEINAAEHDRYADWSWDAVAAAAEEATSRLVASIRAADFSQPAMAALLSSSIGNGCSHPIEHLFTLPHDRVGERLLTTLEGRLADVVSSGLLPDAAAGVTIYNQACRRTLAGQFDIAREMLRTAFRLNPGLVDWAPKDTDLRALWSELGSLVPQ